MDEGRRMKKEPPLEVQRLWRQLEKTKEALRKHDATRVEEIVPDSGKDIGSECFRLLAESIPGLVWSACPDGTSDYYNCRFLEYLGKTKDEMLSWTWVSTLHPDDQQRSTYAWTEAFTKGTEFRIEYRIRRADGQYRWHIGQALPLRNDAGKIVCWFGTCVDIDDRKRAQEATEEIKRQQEAILNNISDLAWMKDREGRYITVNDPFCQITGSKPEDVVGRTDFDFWPKHLAEKYRADDQDVIRTGKKMRVEELQADKDGELYWVETIKSPIFDEHHEVIGTTGIARDISERRRMEETLRHVSRALKAVTECRQAMMRATQEADLLNEVCRIIVEVGGYRMAWVGFGCQDDAKSVQAIAQQGFDSGYINSLRLTWADVERGQGPTGTAIRTGNPAIIRDTQTDPRFVPWRKEAHKRGFASVLGLPLGDNQPYGALTIYAIDPNAFDDEEINLLIGLANDLAFGLKTLRTDAERRRAEEALRDSEQKLRLLASQLLSVQEKERNRLSRELHDELGSALTVLKIHIVAVENSLRSDQEDLKLSCEHLQNYIDIVIENVRRLSRDLSPSILKDLGLSSSLKYLIGEICQNNHMFHTVTMDEIDQLFSPEAQINIYRIFQESLTNIIRHAEASRIEVDIKRENDLVTFRLKDDGKGFDMKRISSRSLEKRGLGLTVMHERALMSGGSLTISSQAGQGTRLRFSIPISLK